ncbi:MAG TPA: hypothetical protein VJZ00_10310, partial [Thermoanaerobaculia bacterium]|nr:hypothetical protein [Thermoanaerobaculia bacterium]
MSAFRGAVDFTRPDDLRWIAGAASMGLDAVLRAYEQWGPDAPSHLEGDFAFAIWDALKRELFCARD